MAGLRDFQKKNNHSPRAPAWFRLNNGQSKEVQFLVEPTEIKFVVEHVSPEDWKLRAVCTEEQCYACEQKTYKWNQSIRLYLPLLHQGKTQVFAQGVGANSILHDMMKYYMERGTVKDVLYKVTRTGEGKRSAYTAEPLDSSPVVVYNRNVDVTQLTKTVEYTKQKTYYKEK